MTDPYNKNPQGPDRKYNEAEQAAYDRTYKKYTTGPDKAQQPAMEKRVDEYQKAHDDELTAATKGNAAAPNPINGITEASSDAIRDAGVYNRAHPSLDAPPVQKQEPENLTPEAKRAPTLPTQTLTGPYNKSSGPDRKYTEEEQKAYDKAFQDFTGPLKTNQPTIEKADNTAVDHRAEAKIPPVGGMMEAIFDATRDAGIYNAEHADHNSITVPNVPKASAGKTNQR